MRAAARDARVTVAVTVAAAALGAAAALLAAAPAQAATDHATPLGGATASMAVDASTGRLPAGWRNEMLSRINAARLDAGISPLKACASLRRAVRSALRAFNEGGCRGRRYKRGKKRRPPPRSRCS